MSHLLRFLALCVGAVVILAVTAPLLLFSPAALTGCAPTSEADLCSQGLCPPGGVHDQHQLPATKGTTPVVDPARDASLDLGPVGLMFTSEAGVGLFETDAPTIGVAWPEGPMVFKGCVFVHGRCIGCGVGEPPR